MNTIAAALLALSVLAGIAAPAIAYDNDRPFTSERFFDDLDRRGF
jgi:hypothetical protein